jgi:hypothetical protein
MQTGMC